jgi:hypothetical protein
MMKLFLIELDVWVNVKFVLYQLPRNSRHVSRLPCEDVPIFLEEFDEHEILFRIQIIPHMSDVGGLIRGEWDCLIEFFLDVMALGWIGSVWNSATALFNYWSSVDASSMPAVL